MARIERARLYQEKELPLFSVDAAKFAEIVFEKFPADVSISAKIGDWKSSTTTFLDNREDILNHLALLNNSFEMSAGKLTIKISKFENSITFDESQLVAAEAIVADLDHYVPLYKRVTKFLSTKPAFFIPAACVVYLIIVLEASLEKFGQLAASEKNLIFSIAMLPMFANILIFWVRPRVFHKLKDSFFRRNNDQIIWALLAYLAGNLTPDFSLIKAFLINTLGLTGL